MAQVQQLQSGLEQASNAYAAANVQLAKIDTDLQSNERNLVAARKSLGVAQGAIAERLRDLYVNGNGDSTLEVLLGSQSLDDIITRLDAIHRVSNQDAKVLNAVKKYRKEVETRRANLQDARTTQAQVVAERAAQKRSIESQVAEQQQLLASVKDEIVKLQAEEQQRQAELAAQARARLQAQQAAAAAAQQAAATQSVTPNYVPDPVYEPEPSARALHGCGRDRAAVPRHPVRVGRREPGDRLRLLRIRDVRVRAARRLAPAQCRRAVRLRHTGAA